MVTVPRGKTYDEVEFPGRRAVLNPPGGTVLQLGNNKQGYGGMRVNPGPVSAPNITDASYANLDVFQEISTAPELCSLDPVTGYFKFLVPGIWMLSWAFSMRHNNAAAYREMSCRFHNVTTGANLPSFQIPTGTNAVITNGNFQAIYEVSESGADGDNWNIQTRAGTGMSYSAVSFETCNFSMSLQGVLV